MKKKAQAAMEFLMTYGWAILVVLVVIAALAYFGVLNPQQFLPRKCQFSQGLVCLDHKLDQSTENMSILISNGLGNDIGITAFTFQADNGLVKCEDNAVDTVLAAGRDVTLIIDCTTFNADPGIRVKGDMELIYKDLQTSFTHKVPGTLLTDVQ